MNKTIPTHAEITDFAKLTLLVYEYGKAYEVDSKTTIEEFVANVVEKN